LAGPDETGFEVGFGVGFGVDLGVGVGVWVGTSVGDAVGDGLTVAVGDAASEALEDELGLPVGQRHPRERAGRSEEGTHLVKDYPAEPIRVAPPSGRAMGGPVGVRLTPDR